MVIAEDIKIGDVFRREGLSSIRICGFTASGDCLVRQVLPVRERELLVFFRPHMLVEGAILRYPNGRVIQLVKNKQNGIWHSELAEELIECSLDALEQMEPVK